MSTVNLANDLATQYQGRRVLVTGGLGFLGNNLARRLSAWGARVTIVDSLIPEGGGNPFHQRGLEDGTVIEVADLRAPGLVASLLPGCQVVFHLAGRTGHLDSMRDPQADLDSNVVSTLALLEACRQHTPHARVVFTSTRQVYGKPLRVPLDETHPIQPVDVNAVHKLAAEQHLRLYSQVYGLSVCVLRLTNVIGPRMRIRDARQSFLGDWVRRMIQGEPLEVWGGEQERDLLGIDDCLDALLLAGCHTAAAGEIFNVGHERSLSLAQIAEQFIAINGSGKTIIRPFPAERSRIDIGSFATDSSRLRTRLGWNPRLDLSSTLQQTLEYHRMYWDHYV